MFSLHAVTMKVVPMPIVTTPQVYSTGRGDFGRLGHGDEENKLEPALVEGTPIHLHAYTLTRMRARHL
jgi:hypothetical protein